MLKYTLKTHQKGRQFIINGLRRNDNGIRTYAFLLVDKSGPLALPESCIATLFARLPNGITVYEPCLLKNSTVIYKLCGGQGSPTITATAGTVNCEIRVTSQNGEVITSPKFAFYVEDVLQDDSAIEAQPSFSALTEALGRVITAEDGLSSKIDKIDGEKGNIAIIDGDGNLTDSGIIPKKSYTIPFYSSSSITEENKNLLASLLNQLKEEKDDFSLFMDINSIIAPAALLKATRLTEVFAVVHNNNHFKYSITLDSSGKITTNQESIYEYDAKKLPNGLAAPTGNAVVEFVADYVSEFTDNAKYVNEEQLKEALAKDKLPDYWEEYLPDKIEAIKALQRSGGKDCFSFVFIADIHHPTNLGERSPLIAKRIMDACNIKYTLNCGDTQTRGCNHTKEDVFAENKKVAEMFAPVRGRLLSVEGNHDGSYYWSGGVSGSGTAYVKQLDEKEMFEEYYRINCLSGDAHFDKNSNAFYVDDVSNKTRYIGLNSMNVPNDATDVNVDGTAKYPKMHTTQFLQAQYDFLCNDALTNGLADDWCVVVFGHSGIYNSGDYGVMVDVLSAYKNKTNCVAEYAGVAGGGAAYTNLADPTSSDWKDGYRISSSAISAQTGKTTTNLIECAVGDIIRVKGVEFAANADRVCISSDTTTAGQVAYVSVLPNDYYGYEYVDGVHIFTIKQISNAANKYFRCCFDTPTDASNVIITKNQEIVESAHGYDYVSVNYDFSNAKGEFIAYFHGHEHQDKDYTRDSIKDIATRCDAREENTEELKAERIAGTVTEQSFDVFTVNKKTRTINATKIGAGVDREIRY